MVSRTLDSNYISRFWRPHSIPYIRCLSLGIRTRPTTFLYARPERRKKVCSRATYPSSFLRIGLVSWCMRFSPFPLIPYRSKCHRGMMSFISAGSEKARRPDSVWVGRLMPSSTVGNKYMYYRAQTTYPQYGLTGGVIRYSYIGSVPDDANQCTYTCTSNNHIKPQLIISVDVCGWN